MLATGLLSVTNAFNGVNGYSGADLENRPMAEGKTYKAIVPKSFIAWVVIYTTIAIGFVIGMFVWTLLSAIPPPADQQSDFFTDNSWCFITPKYAPDHWMTNMCVLASSYSTSGTTVSGDYLPDGTMCTFTTDGMPIESFAFCNTDPASVTQEWCQNIFNQVVVNTGAFDCGHLEFTFTTPSNYTSVGYMYAHDGGDFLFWYIWAYPAVLMIWLAFVFYAAFTFPAELTRSGDGFNVKHCCCTSRLNAKDVSMVFSIDEYNWCVHRYLLRGIRYMSYSCLRGVQANGEASILLLGGPCQASYRLSFPKPVYEEFLRDNLAVAMPVQPVMQQGTIAVGADANVPTAYVVARGGQQVGPVSGKV